MNAAVIQHSETRALYTGTFSKHAPAELTRTPVAEPSARSRAQADVRPIRARESFLSALLAALSAFSA